MVLTVAAFAGNAAGYEIGRSTGPRIFRRDDSRLFKQEYVDKTVTFFDTYGPRAIVLARFVPIVRTFITVMAGRRADGPAPVPSPTAGSARCCGRAG